MGLEVASARRRPAGLPCSPRPGTGCRAAQSKGCRRCKGGPLSPRRPPPETASKKPLSSPEAGRSGRRWCVHGRPARAWCGAREEHPPCRTQWSRRLPPRDRHHRGRIRSHTRRGKASIAPSGGASDDLQARVLFVAMDPDLGRGLAVDGASFHCPATAISRPGRGLSDSAALDSAQGTRDRTSLRLRVFLQEPADLLHLVRP